MDNVELSDYDRGMLTGLLSQHNAAGKALAEMRQAAVLLRGSQPSAAQDRSRPGVHHRKPGVAGGDPSPNKEQLC